jgi:AMP nucleosidase
MCLGYARYAIRGKKMTEPEDFYYESEMQEVVARDTLERYSGSPVSDFQPYLILTNFPRYVEYFAETRKCEIVNGAMFNVAHCPKEGISILDFKIGSPAAALIIDLCSFLPITAVLLLGMCGGLRPDYQLGEYMVPVASIRGDGTSDFYFPPEVPALANFSVQKVVTDVLEEEKAPYHTGITHTTNKRFWEFNADFRNRLKATRPQAVEMECATLFCASYSHHFPLGALLLISDLPFSPGGVKTKKSSDLIFTNFMSDHIEKGIRIIHRLKKVERLKKYLAYRSKKQK